MTAGAKATAIVCSERVARMKRILGSEFLTLQHAVIHCNTLQQAATHCNALQHTAAHRSSLQQTAAYCNTHNTTNCSMLQHTASYSAHFNTLQPTAKFCETHLARHILRDTSCETHLARHMLRDTSLCHRHLGGEFMTLKHILHHTATHCNALQHTRHILGVSL